MQRRCCGMHTNPFPTHRIKSIGQVRTSSALVPHPPPISLSPSLSLPLLLSKTNAFPSYLGLKCLILLDHLSLEQNYSRDFLLKAAISPSLSLLLSLVLLSLSSTISAFHFTLVWICCDRILFQKKKKKVLSSSPIFFDFAAPLPFSISMRPQGFKKKKKFWHENSYKFGLYLKIPRSSFGPPLVDPYSFLARLFIA